MKKTKRLVAYALSAIIALGTLPNAMAEGEIVYSYENDSQSTVNVTEAEIYSGNWNIDYMSKLPIEPYEDFPMTLERNTYGMAQLRIFGTYLKNVREDEIVTFSVIDRNTNQAFYSQEITAEDSSIMVEDIPMDKTFNLVIKSEYNGTEEEYIAVIRTYYGAAVMPEYISLSENTTDSSEIRIKDLTLGNTYTEDENGEQVLNRHLSFIEAAELKEFYSAISDNHLYDVQTNNDGNLYKGYMSKATKYDCDYVFAPMYDYYLEDDYLEAMSRPQTLDYTGHMGIAINNAVGSGESITHNNLMDILVMLNANNVSELYEIPLYNTGEYVIRAYSNSQNKLYYATSPNGNYDNLTWYEVPDTAAGKRISYADDQTLFLVPYSYTETASIILNVSFVDSTDSVSNSIYELNTSNTSVTMDTEISGALEYEADVDVFLLNCSSSAQYSFILTNNLGRENLYLSTYSIESDGFTFYEDEQVYANKGQKLIADFDLPATSTAKYFAMIHTNDNLDVDTGSYKIEFRTPTCNDPYEGNNLQTTATDLSTLTSPLYDATIDRGDKDFYKFEVGPGGANVVFDLSSSCAELRDMILYNESDTYTITGETVGGVNNITATLPENDTYYLWIRSTSNSSYCSGHPYTLGWSITQLNPYTVTFNRNVTYEMTVGNTDPTELLMVVAQATTCTNNESGATINTMTKMNNLKLFYMNGNVETEITETTIGSIPAGTYTITAELYGISLTGYTITLIIS